jgi:hypothetical protein
MTFRLLFIESLEHHRVIIMGIYRLLDVSLQNNQSIDDQKRIFIYANKSIDIFLFVSNNKNEFRLEILISHFLCCGRLSIKCMDITRWIY